MREIQNDLLFSYCLIYLLNGLIDVSGSPDSSSFFSFKIILKERGGCQEFHQHSQCLPTGVYSQ